MPMVVCGVSVCCIYHRLSVMVEALLATSLLSEAEFSVFSRLRVIDKQLAATDAVVPILIYLINRHLKSKLSELSLKI